MTKYESKAVVPPRLRHKCSGDGDGTMVKLNTCVEI